MKTMTLYKILGIIQENEYLDVFNKTARLTQSIIEQLADYHSRYRHLVDGRYKPVKDLYMENSIILEGVEFNIPENKWDYLHQIIIKINDLEDVTDAINTDLKYPDKPNLLLFKVKKIFDKISNTKKENKEYVKFYMEIQTITKHQIFIKDLLHHIIIIGQNNPDIFKRTHFNIQIAEAIILFYIQNIPFFLKIKNSLKLSLRKNKRNNRDALLFIEHILNYDIDNNNINTIFETLESKNIIKCKMTFNLVYYHIKNLILEEYRKGTISNLEIKTIIDKIMIVRDIKSDFIDVNNKYKALLLKIGDYFTSYLIEENIFEENMLNIKQGEKLKTTLMLNPSIEIVNQISKINVYQKPFLIKEQIRNVKLNKDNNGYFHIINQKLTNFIHQNPKILFKIKHKNFYTRELKNVLYTKYSIYPYYLKIQLLMLNQYVLQKDQLMIEKFFGCVYDFDMLLFNEIRSLEPVLNSALDFILEEGMRFDRCLSSSDVYSLLEITVHLNMKKNFLYKQEIKTFINKLCHRKQNYVDLINESILYSSFHHVIYTSFLDARGRKYSTAGATSIQNNPLAKILVRLTNLGNDVLLDDISIALVAKNFWHESPKVKLDDINNKDIELQEKESMLIYIQSLSINTIEEIYDFIFSEDYLDSMLLYNKIKAKKAANHLLIHSLIIYEQEKARKQQAKHLTNYIEKDATSSGLQMISILFQSPEIAKRSYLSKIDGEDSVDIYTHITLECHNFYKKISAFTNSFFKTFEIQHEYLSDLDLSARYLSESDWILIENEIEDPFLYWICLDIYQSTRTDMLLHYLANKINIMRNEDISLNIYFTDHKFIDIIDEIFNLLDNKTKSIFEIYVSQKRFISLQYILKYLFCIRFTSRLVIIGEIKIPFINTRIWTRNLFKKAVMTYFYGSTNYGRKDDFLDHIKTIALIDLDKKTEKYLFEFITYLDKFFIDYLHKIPNFKLMDDFIVRVIEKHVKTHKIKRKQIKEINPIVISNPNFEIQMEPRETYSYQIQCPGFKKARGHQLTIKQLSENIDIQKLTTMFGANLIHSMDSHIVHTLLELTMEINRSFQSYNLSHRLIIETNHDCYYSNYPLLLPALLEECYLRLIRENYINYISGLSEQDKKDFTIMSNKDFLELLTPINPKFIK